jgi:hypothetical protein
MKFAYHLHWTEEQILNIPLWKIEEYNNLLDEYIKAEKG